MELDYELSVFVPEILRAIGKVKIMETGERKEGNKAGQEKKKQKQNKKPTREVSLLFKFPFLRNEKY